MMTKVKGREVSYQRTHKSTSREKGEISELHKGENSQNYRKRGRLFYSTLEIHTAHPTQAAVIGKGGRG